MAQELKKTQWWKSQLSQGRCYFCGRRFHPKELTMDHIIPIARGGRSTKSNVRPACRECNHNRRYFLPEEWAWLKVFGDQSHLNRQDENEGPISEGVNTSEAT